MTGAKVLMMTLTLLDRGISYLDTIATELLIWMRATMNTILCDRSVAMCQGRSERLSVPTGQLRCPELLRHAELERLQDVLVEGFYKLCQQRLARPGFRSQHMIRAHHRCAKNEKPVLAIFGRIKSRPLEQICKGRCRVALRLQERARNEKGLGVAVRARSSAAPC